MFTPRYLLNKSCFFLFFGLFLWTSFNFSQNHWKTIDVNGEPQNHSFNGNGWIGKNHWKTIDTNGWNLKNHWKTIDTNGSNVKKTLKNHRLQCFFLQKPLPFHRCQNFTIVLVYLVCIFLHSLFRFHTICHSHIFIRVVFVLFYYL